MRRLKFRAWNKHEECFVDEEEFAINFLGTVFKANLDAEVYNNCMSQNNFELMQCTGLKDKNGKEIYKGDIVYIDNNATKNYEVEYIMCCYGISTVNGFMILSDIATSISDGTNAKCEVIGNIYENKNLLE